ncbi:MAG: lipoprotein-releasing system ATP-binding protein LolD [Candidatus Makaraimicrobium thalassicum]|nr:MAG: lipoprotein-releasing system ATP-binding protein LolD [Candidatus Omnitrophota bacterium]
MIITKNISKTFGQGTRAVRAVKDVNIRIEEGERVYIHGPSGAGKSTLLHMLGGLNLPTAGTVTFRGKDVYYLRDRGKSRLRNRHFGFIFQSYHLLPELNVLENVMLPAMIKGGESAAGIRSRAAGLLETVGMDGRLKHRPGQLSGGEAQRTAIARALVNSPDILFCDEPAGSLDSEMREGIYLLIRDISEKNGMSVVVVSHQAPDRGFFHSEYAMKDGVLGRMTNDTSEGSRETKAQMAKGFRMTDDRVQTAEEIQYLKG